MGAVTKTKLKMGGGSGQRYDEMQEQEDVSFYRRLNVEVERERRQQLRQTRDQLEELQDIVGGSEDVSDHKVLSQLEEKLNAYIQELPVLGFNSGRIPKNSCSRTSSSISPSSLL